MNTATQTMSDREAIDYIKEIPQARREWPHLSREEKRFVIASLSIGLNREWILDAIEDAKLSREGK